MYVISMVCPLRPASKSGKAFLTLEITSCAIQYRYTTLFRLRLRFFAALLAFLFIRSLLFAVYASCNKQIPSITLYAETSHTYDSECLPAAEAAAAKTFPPGGTPKYLRRPTRWLPTCLELLLLLLLQLSLCVAYEIMRTNSPCNGNSAQRQRIERENMQPVQELVDGHNQLMRVAATVKTLTKNKCA